MKIGYKQPNNKNPVGRSVDHILYSPAVSTVIPVKLSEILNLVSLAAWVRCDPVQYELSVHPVGSWTNCVDTYLADYCIMSPVCLWLVSHAYATASLVLVPSAIGNSLPNNLYSSAVSLIKFLLVWKGIRLPGVRFHW